MNYILILGVLIAVAVVLILIIIGALVIGSINKKKYDYEDEHAYDDDDDLDDDEDFDDEDEEEELDDEDDDEDEEEELDDDDELEEEEEVEEEVEEEIPARPVRKQWKLVVENLETWEKRSILFYDNLGIGRKREGDQFEKFYVIKDDPRASKLHCAIISRGDNLYLKDMGSRNGTYLNGEKIDRPIIIQKEDVIGAGETQIEIKRVLREK